MFHDCQLSGIQMEIIQVKAPIHNRGPREAGFGMVTACGCQEGHIQHWHRGSTQEEIQQLQIKYPPISMAEG